jgi:hypothetical protein
LNEKAGLFGRFGVAWTPTVLVLTPRGAEVYRIEGYLPKDLFRPELELGLARVDFMGKQFPKAERWYDHILTEHPRFAAEAMYWRAVCRYSASHDPSHLVQVSQDLRQSHPDSIWSVKASVWAPATADSERAKLL